MKPCFVILATLALLPIFAVPLFAAEERVVVSIRYLQIKGESHYGLYLFEADGKLIRRLTHPADGQDTHPVFSADGKTVYFMRTSRKKQAFYAVGLEGKHLRQLGNTEATEYKAISDSPSFGYNDYDFSNKNPEPVLPLHYPAPDGSVELVYEAFDENETAPSEGDHYDTEAQHTFLVDLHSGSKTPLASLPGCEGIGQPLKLSDASHAVYLLAPPLRTAFLDRHLNSTAGTAVFALDLDKRRLVRLGPIWATVYPLPDAPAFYTVATERYQPLGDGRTVNCSYLERWNADFEKVRFADPKVALCGGASVYRKDKPPLYILRSDQE